MFVIDAGDEVLGQSLDVMVKALDSDPETHIAYPLAVLGSSMIVNAMIPESRRLERFAYLGTGYLVRRSWLEQIGRFSEDEELEEFVDHDFWTRSAALDASTVLLRNVGIRIWPKRPEFVLSDVDPGAAAQAIHARARAAGLHRATAPRASSGPGQPSRTTVPVAEDSRAASNTRAVATASRGSTGGAPSPATARATVG